MSQMARFSGEKNEWNIKCVFLFSLEHLSKTFAILRRIERDVINVKTPSRKVFVTLVRL
jgi:hypothetical protein